MNNKGFTLVELLATLVILALVVGITISTLNINFRKAKEKTEEVFVDTLRDAVDVYLSSNFGGLTESTTCSMRLSKKWNQVDPYQPESGVKVDKITTIVKFSDVINSSYTPLTESEFVNPANEDVDCNTNAEITVYKDEDSVYYYYIKKEDLSCLNNISNEYSKVITNLPKVSSNGDEEGYFKCH